MDDQIHSKPWILMSAEAALGCPERVAKISETFDIIIVPRERFVDAVKCLDSFIPEEPDGK